MTSLEIIMATNMVFWVTLAVSYTILQMVRPKLFVLANKFEKTYPKRMTS